jgi:hypothetical protein
LHSLHLQFAPRGLLFETTVILKYHPEYNSVVDQVITFEHNWSDFENEWQVFSVRCFYPDMTADKRSVSNGTSLQSNEFSADEAVVYVCPVNFLSRSYFTS